MMTRQVLPVSGVIEPGERKAITVSPRVAFRPERIMISPASFRVSRLRWALTLPFVGIGRVLAAVAAALAWILRVDVNAPREHVVHLPDLDQHARMLAEDSGRDIFYDADDEAYERIPIPPSRRERIVLPLRKLARHRLREIRLRWQESQLGRLLLRDVRIATVPTFCGPEPMPADMFGVAHGLVGDIQFATCEPDRDIVVELENGSAHACHLAMALVGVSPRLESDTQRDAQMRSEWSKIIGTPPGGTPGY